MTESERIKHAAVWLLGALEPYDNNLPQWIYDALGMKRRNVRAVSASVKHIDEWLDRLSSVVIQVKVQKEKADA